MRVTLRDHRWLLLILLLYTLLGLAYGRVTPLAEAPDELDHFLYVQYLLTEGRFPVMQPVAADNATMEANQPPLYYLLGAAVTGWIDSRESAELPLNACYTFDPYDNGRRTLYRHSLAEQFPYRDVYLAAFHLVRLLSLLLGAGTVALAYGLGRQIVPGDQRVGLGAAALLAFNPQFIFITSSVNNDVLTTFLGTAVLFLSIAAVRQPTHGRFLALGLLVGLGLLTKFALLAFWPLALLAAVWVGGQGSGGAEGQGSAGAEGQGSRGAGERGRLAYSSTRQLAYLAARLLAIILLPIFVAGWWYWRAYRLYGDPLAWAVHLEAKGDSVLRTGMLTAADLLDFALIHFQSYWLWFGWLKIKAPDWVYLLLALMVGAAVVGLIRLVVRDWRWNRFNDQSPSTNNPFSVNYPALLFNILAISAIYASLLRYILTINWSGYQGRLAYAAAAPLAVLLALGLWSLAGPRLLKATSVGLLILAAVSLPWLLIPAYPRPAIYQPVVALPDSWSCARFAAGLELEGFEMERRVRPGEELSITLYAYGLTPAAAAQNMRVQLIGRDGAVIGQAQTEWIWNGRQPLATTLTLPVSLEAAPVRAVVQAGLLTAEGEWQTAVSPGGRSLPTPISLATIKVAPVTAVALTPQHLAYADFGRQLALAGYDIGVSDGGIGRETAVTFQLYWQALAIMDEDYTIFVHLLDDDGQLIAQYDGQPHAGAYPTSIWDEGEVVADTVNFDLPSNLSAGPYYVAVGVYDLATLTRLPVWEGDELQADGRFLLPLMWDEEMLVAPRTE